MLRDTSVKRNQCGLWHAGTSVDKTLEARLLGRDSVVLDVWYYCCANVVYVVHVACVMLCTCGFLYVYCVYMFFMKHYV